MKEDLQYWKKRCELAEKYIEESPWGRDIYPEQLEAYTKWYHQRETPVPSTTNLYISAIDDNPNISPIDHAYNARLAYEKNCIDKYDYSDNRPSKPPRKGERMEDYARKFHTTVEEMSHHYIIDRVEKSLEIFKR